MRGRVVTSREVQIQNLLESALDPKGQPSKEANQRIDSKAFGRAVQDALLEMAVSLEAENFNLIRLNDDEYAKAERQVLSTLKKDPRWKRLEVTSAELNAGLTRKLRAKQFVQLRAKSSVLPVTDLEAQKYFNENRLKFGNLPFENFKDNIKSYLGRTQVERRLKDWYDVLLNKYQVKNLLAEM